MSTTTPTKTYSFKAPLEWENRLDRALKTLGDLPDFDSAEGAQIRQELELSILRQRSQGQHFAGPDCLNDAGRAGQRLQDLRRAAGGSQVQQATGIPGQAGRSHAYSLSAAATGRTLLKSRSNW